MNQIAAKTSRSRQQNTVSMSLFPFLAVLICTMGALIVLLVVLARQARLQAAQAAQAAVADLQEKQKDLQTAQEDVQWRIEQLQTARTATQSQLDDARLRLGHIEDHARRLREQIARYEATLKDLQTLGEGGSRQRSEMQSELARLQAEVAKAEQRLAEARQAAAQRRRSFAVIPYEGRFQTHRRPIYIECRSDAIVLQPEGIELSEEDFMGPMGPGNPLAAALRAAREYLLTQGEFDPKRPEEPYPLLLVRPDGIEAYYAARAGMESWGSEFGYELIGGDWKLEYPKPDPRLAQVVTQAVTTARVTQARLIAAAPRAYGAAKPKEYRVTPTRGGVMPADGSAGGGGPGYRPSQPAGPFGSQATASGGGPDSPHGVPGGAYAPAGTHGVDQQGLPSPASGRGAGGEGGVQQDMTAIDPHTGMPMTSPTTDTAGGEFSQWPAAGDPSDASSGGAMPGNTMPAGQIGSGAPGAADTMAGRPPMEHPESTMAPGGTPLRPGEWRPEAEGSSQRSRPMNNARVEIGSLAKTRGQNWGLPDAAAGSVAITRPIRVVCRQDEVTLLDERGRPRGKPIPLRARTEDSIDDIVSAVWNHMESWGIAGRGMYWRPILKLQVAPDAQQRYEELEVLLEGSGMTVQRSNNEP